MPPIGPLVPYDASGRMPAVPYVWPRLFARAAVHAAPTVGGLVRTYGPGLAKSAWDYAWTKMNRDFVSHKNLTRAFGVYTNKSPNLRHTYGRVTMRNTPASRRYTSIARGLSPGVQLLRRGVRYRRSYSARFRSRYSRKGARRRYTRRRTPSRRFQRKGMRY